MTEKKNEKKTLKRVDIPSGTWKYVLIQLGDDSYLVRGREGATYHADAARPTIDLLESMDIDYNVLGGGRIRRDDEKKTILVYGHSIGFPWDKETGFQHDVSVRLIKKAYPDYEVTYSNEGY